MSVSSRRPGFPVVLVGLMGAGKSTVGKLLAARWGIPFIDLDAEIERRSDLSIADIFEREGEAGFRSREADATRAISPSAPVVIAAGGGWMANPETRDAWPGATRVWLTVSPREAARRLAKHDVRRPLLSNELGENALQEILERRLPAYHLSEYTVDTSNRTPAAVAEEVAAVLDQIDVEAGEERMGPELSTES
ncbi:MAG: shikimate kinase [Gemmatimonadota bacterium]